MSQTAAERAEFAPPEPRGMGRALLLALLAHGLLLIALTLSVQWKRDAEDQGVEAELWSAIPQQAAPQPVEPPPPPPPPPQEATPPPKPQPVVTTPPKAQAPDDSARDAEIALEKERKRKEQEKRDEAQREQARQEKLRQEQLERDKAARQKQAEKAAADKAAADKAAAEKKKQEQLRKDEERKKQEAAEAADAKRRAEADAKKRSDAAAAESKQRADNLKRIQGLAGATGGPGATGTAAQSTGPSASYLARLQAKIKPKIVFTDDIPGNPSAEVEVRLAPDGTIVGRKLIKSSGSTTWDEAVQKAIDKTEVLPKDADGRIPSSMIFAFRPRD
ncbi:MAG: cell envelope integrity protein TolA [Curvibacter sp.]|nr:cell envelope integrity protein TolA [Curvibacter sp.]